jgi:hypothetical protein
VVIQAADENGDGDMDEAAALSPRGEQPISRVFERKLAACGSCQWELNSWLFKLWANPCFDIDT